MNRHRHQQWHDVVAAHEVGWEEGPGDGAVLLVPRFRKGPLARWLQPRLKRPFMRVKLDDVGSFVWRSIDGKRPFHAVAALMRERFGERVEPVEERLRMFFSILYKDRFVQLYAPSVADGSQQG